MAQYTVEAPDGRQVTIEGDSAPTEQDLQQVFDSLPNAQESVSSGDNQTTADSSVQSQFKGTGNPTIDNLIQQGAIDPLNEVKRGFLRGGASAATPLSMLLGAAQVPDQYNLPNQSRKLWDQKAENIPQSNMNPVAKLLYNGIGELPGQIAAWEQTGGPVLKGIGATYGAGKSALSSLMESKSAPLQAQKALLDSQVKNNLALNDIQATSIASDMTSKMAEKKLAVGQQIKNITENIKTASDQATKNARSTVLDYWNELKTNFGKDYAEAGKGLKITPEKELQALNNAANDAGIYGKIESGTPLSEADKKILSLIEDSQKRYSSDLNVARPLSEFDSDINSLINEHGGDHAVTSIRKNVADLLDEFKTVRAKYREPYQLKNEMFKIFQPFNKSGSFDTTSGTNLLTRVFNSKANPDEIRLVDALSKRDPALFSNLSTLKTSRDSLISGLQDTQANHVKELSNLAQDAQTATEDALVEHKIQSDLLDSLITKAKSQDAKNLLIGSLMQSAAKGASTAIGAGGVVGTGLALHKILSN